MAGRGKVVIFKSVATLIELLPERVSLAMASALASIISNRQTKAKSNLEVNVAHALGSGATKELIDDVTRRGFLTYAQYWVEGAKLPAMKRKKINERFVIAEGLENVEEAKKRGKGVIIALPHIGSWEWGGSFLDSLGFGMTAIAENLEPPELFAWFKEKRESIGIKVEPLNESAGAVLLDTLKSGGVVGLLSDRDIAGNGVDVTFFGEQVSIPSGAATLALRTGATLLCAACYSGPGRDHFAVVTPPLSTDRRGGFRDDVKRVTQDMARELEHLIRRAPEQWHVLQPRFTGDANANSAS